jgi:hypothetical protein
MAVLGDGGVVVGGTFAFLPMYVYDKVGAQYGLDLTPTPSSMQFTTLGTSGPTGPTTNTYSYPYPWLASSVTLSGGKQLWTVQMTGYYTFGVAGAHGAMGTSTTTGTRGGRGAIISGTVFLTQGHVLSIVVGQAGSYDANNGGGGGASSVFDTTTSTLLFVAGGGGGTRMGAVRNGTDASIYLYGYTAITSSTNDTTSLYTNDNTTFAYNAQTGTVATLGSGGLAGASGYGDGGAGWGGNGNDDSTVSTVAGALNVTAVGGGVGQGGAGGFGGGGSGTGGNGGGGGGGYTGGNGGFIAGGGGSYYSPTATNVTAVIDTGRSYLLNGAPVHGYVTATVGITDAYILKMDPSGLMA